jgi:hypothetical protein
VVGVKNRAGREAFRKLLRRSAMPLFASQETSRSLTPSSSETVTLCARMSESEPASVGAGQPSPVVGYDRENVRSLAPLELPTATRAATVRLCADDAVCYVLRVAVRPPLRFLPRFHAGP